MAKKAAHRPTKLTKKMVETLEEYIGHPQIAGHPIPSQIGFCFYAKIDESTPAKWKKQQKDNENYKEFFSTFRRLGTLSQLTLFHGGLLGEFKEGMAKFGLSAWHNWRDKSDVTTDDQKMDGIQVINYGEKK